MSRARQQTMHKLTMRQVLFVMLSLAVIAVVASLLEGIAFESLFPATDVKDTDQDRPLKQTVLPVSAKPLEHVDQINQSRRYTGTIRARRRSDLAFEITGKITKILVDEGDRVEAGQLIAELDAATLLAQQAAATAGLEQAKSVMTELNAGPRQERIAAAQADAKAAQSEFDNATVRLKRRAALVRANSIPAEEYDQAKFDVRTTRARLLAATERLAELQAGTREERVTAQQAAVRQLGASVEEMEVLINKCQLIAPYAATVTRRHVDPGSIAQPAAPVCTLVERQSLEAWVGLPVDVATTIQTGKSYQVFVNQQAYWVVAAAKIGELDIATRTQTVLFRFDTAATDSLVPGQLCQIQLTTPVKASGFWIPNSALAKGIRGLSSVMVLEPATLPNQFFANKRDIEIVKTDAGRVLARGTIAEGDLVITAGLHRITDGQRVCWYHDSVQPSDSQTPPAPAEPTVLPVIAGDD